MRASRTLIVALFLVVAVLLWFAYQQWRGAERVPPEVLNSPDYSIALSEALRVRIYEIFAGPLFFGIIIFALALTRAVIVSWLRTLLGAVIAFFLVWVIFAKLVEAEFQARFPGAPLPLGAVIEVALYGLGGILLGLFVFLVTERVYVWRLDK